MLTPETILNAQKAQLDTLFQFAHKTFDNMEKLVQLNMAASRAALQDAANHSHQLLGVKDAPQLMAVQTQWLQPLAEKATAYSRSVYEIANGTSTEFVQSVEARTTELQKHLSELIDNTAKNAPVGTEAAVAVMKNAVAAATTAVESVQKAVKQASDMAQSNMQTVSKNVADAVKSSSQKA